MITKYFVYWIKIVDSEQPSVARPELREYSTLHWAQTRCESVFEGWGAQLVQVTASTIEEVDAVKEELILFGRW